VKPEVDRHG